MARIDNFTNFATDVADSIREKTGETGLIPASEFDTKIKSIQTSSGPSVTKNVYLIKDGVEQTDFTEGSTFTKLEGTDEGAIVTGNGYMGLCTGMWANWRIIFNRTFDFSKYKKLYIDYAFPTTNNVNYKDYIAANLRIMTTDNPKYFNDNFLVGKTIERTTIEYDLSEIPEGQIAIHAMNLAESNYTNYPLQIFNVYFEIESEYQDKVVEITSNGTQTILPDLEYVALSSVEVSTHITNVATIEKEYLIQNGVDQTDFTGGHTYLLVDADGPIKETQNSGYISLAAKQWSRAEFTFNNAIDFTKYNKLYIDYDFPKALTASNAVVAFKITDNDDLSVVLVQTNVVTRTVVEIDVSSLTTSNQVLVEILNLANTSSYENYPFNIYNIWLDYEAGVQDKVVEITENGTYNITPDEGYYTLSSVEVIANVASSNMPERYIATVDWNNSGYPIKYDIKGVKSIPQYFFKSNTYVTDVNIDDTTTSLSHECFYGCTNLENVLLPDTITSFGMRVFSGCSKLKLSKLPDSLDGYMNNDQIFMNCQNITIKTIPDGITYISGSGIFKNCTSIVQMSMRNVTGIGGSYSGGGDFNGCTGLKAVWIGSKYANSTAYRYTFEGCTSLIKFYIDLPRATVEAFTNYQYTFMNDTSKTGIIVCNDDEGFITKEEFDAIDWTTYTE